jgi:NADP-dependent 3-hydroxy acid dehydrogenase YdfG
MIAEELRGLFDLSGRTVIVTGGTRGIGFALAQGHLAAGANVVAMAAAFAPNGIRVNALAPAPR